MVWLVWQCIWQIFSSFDRMTTNHWLLIGQFWHVRLASYHPMPGSSSFYSSQLHQFPLFWLDRLAPDRIIEYEHCMCQSLLLGVVAGRFFWLGGVIIYRSFLVIQLIILHQRRRIQLVTSNKIKGEWNGVVNWSIFSPCFFDNVGDSSDYSTSMHYMPIKGN